MEETNEKSSIMHHKSSSLSFRASPRVEESLSKSAESLHYGRDGRRMVPEATEEEKKEFELLKERMTRTS